MPTAKTGCTCKVLGVIVYLWSMAGCASEAALRPAEAEFGAHPRLVAPSSSLLPSINVAKATGWPDGEQPKPAAGLTVTRFADGLDHPRWLRVLPNGDVLVAETNRPATEGGFSGIKGWVANWLMRYSGGGGASANRITLLRDIDHDGVADVRSVFIEGLNSPLGMALYGNSLYVANTDALLRFAYTPGQTRIDTPATVVAPLPAGKLNHHWTKNVEVSADGKTLYVAVGSNSNIGENGMAAEHQRAAILAIDADTGATRVYASGLRNPVGLAWHPQTGDLWTVVNERDELGDQLVPDYLTAVPEGAFFGWPYSYWGQIVDTRVAPQQPERVAEARAPDYALGAHTASLGLAFYDQSGPIAQLQGMALIGQHGSWNRSVPSGYQVVAVPFSDGQPTDLPMTVLSGFLSDDGDAYGRPAGVAVDAAGGVLVADDVGDVVWRISALSADQ